MEQPIDMSKGELSVVDDISDSSSGEEDNLFTSSPPLPTLTKVSFSGREGKFGCLLH